MNEWGNTEYGLIIASHTPHNYVLASICDLIMLRTQIRSSTLVGFVIFHCSLEKIIYGYAEVKWVNSSHVLTALPFNLDFHRPWNTFKPLLMEKSMELWLSHSLWGRGTVLYLFSLSPQNCLLKVELFVDETIFSHFTLPYSRQYTISIRFCWTCHSQESMTWEGSLWWDWLDYTAVVCSLLFFPIMFRKLEWSYTRSVTGSTRL